MEQWQKIKISFLGFILAIGISVDSSCVFGQNEQYIRPGLISLSGTLAPSLMLNRKEANYYIMGFIEGKFHKYFSVRGDIYGLTGNSNTKFLRHNIRSFIGLVYGYPINNFEPHVGILPGFSIMESNRNVGNVEFTPSLEINAGIRYYVWKYFHFFADVSYIHAQMNNLKNINGLADDITFNVGLGFNFNVGKKHIEK